MRGNGGYSQNIGNNPTNTGADGVYDLFDQRNFKTIDSWPYIKKFISLSPNSGSYNEGTQINFTITVSGFLSNESVWVTFETVSGSISSSDFTDSTLTNELPISNFNMPVQGGTATYLFSKTLVFDAVSESSDIFRIKISSDQAGTQVLGYSDNFTILNPTFSVTPSVSSVNEGSTVQFTINTTNVNSGAILFYSISGVSGADFTDGSTVGDFNIFNNVATVSKTLTEDYITEGTETITFYVRFGSAAGTILAQTSVTVNDTSIEPTATITPSTTSPGEGTLITVDVSTTNFPSGTLYFTVESVLNGEPADDFDTSQFTINISGSTGQYAIATTVDGYTEGNEEFVIRARLFDYDGDVIGTSPTITVSDTSTGDPEPQGIDIASSFYSIAEFTVNDSLADTTRNYSVGEVQSSYSGVGRLYLIHKASGSGESSFYYDAPIACIQVLNSSGTSINQQWWFGASGNPAGWETHTQEYNFGAINAGVNITPSQAASNYTYQAIVNGATADRFNLATSTGSNDTGATDGINEPTTPMTVGNQTMPQGTNTYYIYREMSGGVVPFCALCRSPSRTWSGGEIIRIAYIIGNRPSSTAYIANDTLFVGIA